jgi:hypothetical protein
MTGTLSFLTMHDSSQVTFIICKANSWTQAYRREGWPKLFYIHIINPKRTSRTRVLPALLICRQTVLSITECITSVFTYSGLFEKTLTRLLGFLLSVRFGSAQPRVRSVPKGESQTRLHCMHGKRSWPMIVCCELQWFVLVPNWRSESIRRGDHRRAPKSFLEGCVVEQRPSPRVPWEGWCRE